MELIVSNLNDGFLVKNNILDLHPFDVVFEEHVLDDLLLSLVLLVKLLLGCLTYDPLAPKLGLVAHLTCLLQTSRVEQCTASSVFRDRSSESPMKTASSWRE